MTKISGLDYFFIAKPDVIKKIVHVMNDMDQTMLGRPLKWAFNKGYSSPAHPGAHVITARWDPFEADAMLVFAMTIKSHEIGNGIAKAFRRNGLQVKCSGVECYLEDLAETFATDMSAALNTRGLRVV